MQPPTIYILAGLGLTLVSSVGCGNTDPARKPRTIVIQADAPPRPLSPEALRVSHEVPVVAEPPLFPVPTEQELAARALSRIGKAAVPDLIGTLGNADPRVREQSALVLARIGPEAQEAVPALTTALDDENPAVRKAAAQALGQIGPSAAEAIPALLRTLVDPNPQPPTR